MVNMYFLAYHTIMSYIKFKWKLKSNGPLIIIVDTYLSNQFGLLFPWECHVHWINWIFYCYEWRPKKNYIFLHLMLPCKLKSLIGFKEWIGFRFIIFISTIISIHNNMKNIWKSNTTQYYTLQANITIKEWWTVVR